AWYPRAGSRPPRTMRSRSTRVHDAPRFMTSEVIASGAAPPPGSAGNPSIGGGPAMKLLYQTHSPYARQVLVLAYETGLADRLAVIHHETSPTRRNEAVFAVNPLGKVPVLLLD